jgi:hypothetical protein
VDCVPPCPHSLLQQAVQSPGDDLRLLTEEVMKRQDPERNDPGDSSVVSDSMEIKRKFKKRKKKKGMKQRITDQTSGVQLLVKQVMMYTSCKI